MTTSEVELTIHKMKTIKILEFEKEKFELQTFRFLLLSDRLAISRTLLKTRDSNFM